MSISPIAWSQPNINSQADFSQLANLGTLYREAQKRDQLSELGKQLADGTISYQQAAGKVADMGDVNSTLKFLALSEQEKQRGRALQASRDFTNIIGGTPSASQTIAGPPSVAPKITVGPNAAADEEPPPAPPTRVASVQPTAPVPANAPIRMNPDGTIAGNITAPREPPPIAETAPPAAPPAAVTTPAVPGVAPGSFDDRFAAARPQGVMALGTKDIPRLLGAISNPDLPDAQKEIAKDLYKRIMDQATPTEKIRTLQGLRDNPALLEIEKDLRKSSKTEVNVLPGEKKYDEKMGEAFAEVHKGYINDAAGASKVKSTLDIMERSMSAPGFYSGTGGPAIQAAQRAGVALGLVDADKASGTELFNKMSNKLVTDVLSAGAGGSGLGTGVSNADRTFITDTVPNIQNTPEGNKKIIGVMRLLEDRKVEVAKEVARYAKAHGGRIDMDLTEHLEKWAQKNPLDFNKVPGLTRVVIDTSKIKEGQGTHRDVPFTVNP